MASKHKQIVLKLAENIIGWYGVLAILLAYGLLSFKIIDSDTLVYQLLNLSGALGLIVIAASRKDTQPVVLNVVWATVALVAVVNIVAK